MHILALRRLLLPTAVLLLLTFAGCGEQIVLDDPVPGRSATKGYEVTVTEPDFADPAPVVLRLAGGSTHRLNPWTWCLGNGCADGVPPENPFSVGTSKHVDFTFGIPDFEFTATFRRPTNPEDGRTGRTVEGRVEKIGEHTFRVWPGGPAGTWHVDLFGRGAGDVSTTFAWTTTSTGALPSEADGSVAVLADTDGELDSYGIELFLDDLDPVAPEARAVVEVTSDNGRSVTLDLGRPLRAYEPGAVSWIRGEALGDRAVALGGSSFTYVVTVELDGTTYTGRGRWPEQTNDEITPHVPLVWTPPLPVYDGVD